MLLMNFDTEITKCFCKNLKTTYFKNIGTPTFSENRFLVKVLFRRAVFEIYQIIFTCFSAKIIIGIYDTNTKQTCALFKS